MTPTYRQIAEACNCSPATVCRALGNHRRIPDATRQRIISIARSMGWQPNPFASVYMAHLRSTRPPSFKATLGLLVDYPMPKGVDSLPHWVRRHHDSAKARALAHGYALYTVSLRDPELSLRQVDQVLQNRNVPGVILSSMQTPGTSLANFPWYRYAAIALGYSLVDPILCRVTSNLYRAFDQMIQKAFAMGHERVGVVVSRDFDGRSAHGALFPIAYARERLGPGQWLDTHVTDSTGREAIPGIERWLEKHRPQVVIGIDLAYDAIAALGWRVPTDIAFISVGWSQVYPRIGGWDQRGQLIGEVAVDMLVSQITQNQRGIPAVPLVHLVEGCWKDGPSCPPLKRNRKNSHALSGAGVTSPRRSAQD